MQGSAPVAGRNFALGLARGGQREIRRDPDEGVKARDPIVDPIEQGSV